MERLDVIESKLAGAAKRALLAHPPHPRVTISPLRSPRGGGRGAIVHASTRKNALASAQAPTNSGSRAGSPAGSTSEKTVRPGFDLSSILPPISSASSLAMAKPSPLPEAFVLSPR